MFKMKDKNVLYLPCVDNLFKNSNIYRGMLDVWKSGKPGNPGFLSTIKRRRYTMNKCLKAAKS